MARPNAPLWLAEPSRFAGLKQARARWGLALLVLLLAATLLALTSAGPPPVSHDPAARADSQTDIVLYDGIVDGVRHGGNYYIVTADALRTGDYPLRPFVTFRLPTLAVIEAFLPPWATVALLYTLIAGVTAAWFVRLGPAFARTLPLAVAMVLLVGGLMAFLQIDLASFHEIWAGLLIALGLAIRQPERWVEAVALGLVAMLIRETAALYVGIMFVLALLERQKREATAWGVTIAIFAIVVALHAQAVARVVHPLDPSSPGWTGMLGFGFFVKTMTISTALAIAPAWIAAPLVGLALFGWASWRDPLGLRVLAVFAAYAVLLGLFGRPDTFYWGLLVAPTLLVGLAFSVDGVRDLITSALDRRRIVVTRVSR